MTQAMTSVAAHGPRSTAARTPPSRWPDVPPMTWKLNIWAAKMNAAITPSSGTARSSSVAFVRRTATARTTIVTSHIAAATGIDRKPSGACSWSGGARGSGSRDPRWRASIDAGLLAGSTTMVIAVPQLLQRLATVTSSPILRAMTETGSPDERRRIADGSDAWRDVRDELRSRGLRWTPQRRLILEVLSATEGHITGSELIERCKARDPETTPSTVYRTLDVLEALGYVSHSHSAAGREEFHVLPGRRPRPPPVPARAGRRGSWTRTSPPASSSRSSGATRSSPTSAT